MTVAIRPWMKPAFELIVHAERHLRDGSDFDRRVALISFDNAIEVAITTYLGLHPIQREGREYGRDDVRAWLANYHTKLGFLEQEAMSRGYTLQTPCDEVIYYHKIRGDQYHTGGSGIPESECLSALRAGSLEIFGFLFGVSDVEALIEESLQMTAGHGPSTIPPNRTANWLLDSESEPILLLGQPYRPSEILPFVDVDAYRAVVAAISESRDILEELRQRYRDSLRSEIKSVSIVHYDGSIYLRKETLEDELDLIDADVVPGQADGKERLFSIERSPDENADLLIRFLDPHSMSERFGLILGAAPDEIARETRSDG